MSVPPALSAVGLAAILGTSGTLHVLVPRPYCSIVPAPLAGRSAEVVLASGLAELACAALLLNPRTRRLGGRASAALLVAVFPANVQMTLDGIPRRWAAPGSVRARLATALLWLRLPLQLPLVRWALSLR